MSRDEAILQVRLACASFRIKPSEIWDRKKNATAAVLDLMLAHDITHAGLDRIMAEATSMVEQKETAPEA